MRKLLFVFCLSLAWLAARPARGAIFGSVRGVVHDPQHRPLPGSSVELRAAHSDFALHAVAGTDGAFAFAAVPLGDYVLSASAPGFTTVRLPFTLLASSSAKMHVELPLAGVAQTVSVAGHAEAANVDSVTPTTLVDRGEIAATPGADLSNSLAMVTGFSPGAYITHDMLHMRGGHQVSWLLDGVEIPNTNIGSNLAAQISPRDIDYLETERGSYSADLGDRTFGVFNVVPRSGFERDREAELVLTAGSLLASDDQLSFGDHGERSAYYASLFGHRSDYGLSPPVDKVLHDATNGFGGMVSLLHNRSSADQFRLIAQARTDYFQIPYDPDPNSFENAQYDSSGLRDHQRETDSLLAFTWLHTFSRRTILQLSPFFHRNTADYESDPRDTPTASTLDRTSSYGGGQGSVTTEVRRNTVQAGFYSFGQRDYSRFGVAFHDGSGMQSFSLPASAAGGVVEEFLSDNLKATSWLTIVAGVRATQFDGAFTETAVTPRLGLAVRVPKLGWVFRGFYGRFYQPPPLLTLNGPLLQLAQASDTSFAPLHGERDEEHQFGVQMPWRGWLLDADNFRTHIHNFLDHSNIGDSGIYVPVSIEGGLVRAWELSLRSPRVAGLGQFHLAYSNQIAEQRGPINGGLICSPPTSAECDVAPGYTPVDHDQRNTLSAGFNTSLPGRVTASGEVHYGSGFVNGAPEAGTPYPNAYLPEHTMFDLALSHAFGASTSLAVNALNVANRRVLLDNSLTFGGFHVNDPRQIYAEVRYRFHY